jgi:heme-degrading monooxygenase HmoA
MIIQFIKLKSSLAEEQLLEIARKRESQFREIPGLVQKYYTKTNEPEEYAGIYIWDSSESMQAFRESELAASIPEAYELVEKPDISLFDVMFQLRP